MSSPGLPLSPKHWRRTWAYGSEGVLSGEASDCFEDRFL